MEGPGSGDLNPAPGLASTINPQIRNFLPCPLFSVLNIRFLDV